MEFFVTGKIFKKEPEKEIEVNSDEEKAIADIFGEDGSEMLDKIKTAAKLRILVGKRMSKLKKIPQEFVDKYNDIVDGIRELIKKHTSEDD